MDPDTPQDKTHRAAEIYHALISTRLTDKYKAVDFLRNSPDAVDLSTLRTLLVKGITKDYYAGKEIEQEDRSIGQVRSWLLGTLARIATGDQEATDVVVRHVLPDSNEDYNWAQYWSLDGLIKSRNPVVEDVVRKILDDSDRPMLINLATAYLASQNDKDALDDVRKSLKGKDKWFVLRALRDIPLPTAVLPMCGIVEAGEYTDETYDAIMALGSIPSDWSHVEIAAQALQANIIRMRSRPWMDGMRVGAITGLGNLKVESTGPLLLDELVDNNPAIVREASRSIARILGIRVTVSRVVEAAAKMGSAKIDAYARALRWLPRKEVADELESLMVGGTAQQQKLARSLLSELGGAVAFEKLRVRTDAMKQYSDALEKADVKIRELFSESIHEAQKGFDIAITMDVVVFAAGLLLILGSAGYAMFTSQDLANWAGVSVTGGTGVLGVLYSLLIAKPRQRVTESVDHLMELKVVFLAYLRRLHQTDQAYTRRLLDDQALTVDELSEFSDLLGDIMEDTLALQRKGERRTQESAGKDDSTSNDGQLDGQGVGENDHPPPPK